MKNQKKENTKPVICSCLDYVDEDTCVLESFNALTFCDLRKAEITVEIYQIKRMTNYENNIEIIRLAAREYYNHLSEINDNFDIPKEFANCHEIGNCFICLLAKHYGCLLDAINDSLKFFLIQLSKTEGEKDNG
jgi:hypothetical protein